MQVDHAENLLCYSKFNKQKNSQHIHHNKNDVFKKTRDKLFSINNNIGQ